MAQIQKKFIANNAVDGTKVQFANAQSFVALNASASPVNLFNFSSSNNFQFQQQVDANSNAIINLATPTNPNDAVNKSYADSLVSGLSWKNVVTTATTTTLPSYTYSSGVITATANGALTAQDGVTLGLNDSILVKDETGGNAPYNGIYTQTQVGTGSLPYILTRRSDSATAAEIQSAAVAVGEGASTQAGHVYFESAAITTVGTDNVTYIQINTGMTYTFGNGLNLSGSTVTVVGDPAGAISVSGSGVAVAVDNSTIAISSDQLIVKSGGITNTQVSATAAIAYSKLDLASSVQASDMNSGAATSGQVLTANGSGGATYANPASAPVATSEQITLSGTDITNQYVDLAQPIVGSSATANSLILSVVGAPEQLKGTDYTVSLTGGAGGVTRVTFAGDLATGGNAALVASDILMVNYSY